MICTARPHNPPEALTESRHKVTPWLNPRSRWGSTSNPRVMVESVIPGPVIRPSGVTGAIDTGVVVTAVVLAGVGPSPAVQPEIVGTAAAATAGCRPPEGHPATLPAPGRGPDRRCRSDPTEPENVGHRASCAA